MILLNGSYYLEPGDIIIDGDSLTGQHAPNGKIKGFQFIGTGVSGGEEGALAARPSCRVDRNLHGLI